MRVWTRMWCVLLAWAFGVVGCAGDAAGPVVSPRAERSGATQTVIAFGSCLKQAKPAPIFEHLLAAEPDVLVMLGDNVYVDQPRVPKRAEEFGPVYNELEAQPYWARVRDEVPLLLATWDDHDYGKNDAGQEWPLKEAGKKEFVRFYPDSAAQLPGDRDGIYHAAIVGDEDQRVQFIMLDTRWFRGKLNRKPGPRGKRGPYLPNTDMSRPLLGEAQWAWLEEQLREPADVRVIGSSIQVVSREHGWECWGNFPQELDRLYRLIGETEARGVVFLSGDRHLGEVSKDADAATPYPMWDVTASGFNQDDRKVAEPNRYRQGVVRRTSHFGLLEIDWSAEDPRLVFKLIGEDGEPFEIQDLRLSSLAPRVAE